MTDTIFNQSAIGSFYYISASGITLVLGFIRGILLMRLLGVDSFGAISLAMVFARLVLPFSSMGLDHALLQNKAPEKDTYSTHFILRIGFSIAATLLCLGVSPILRIGYNDQLVNIFLILVIINLVDSTSATHLVFLRKKMRFGTLAIINLCACVSMTILTPMAAYCGAGVWSLVFELALGTMVRWGSVWIIIRPQKFSFKLSISEARAQISFGSQVTSGNILGTFLDRFDDFWVGTTLGATSLGYYSRAYELTQYPERILSAPITSVFISAYAIVQDKRQELSRLFFRSSSFLVRAGLLIGVVMVITAPELITFLFTSRWSPIVPIFRLMTIYILLDPIYINLSAMLVGIGQPKFLNRVRLVQVTLFIPSVIILAQIWGTKGVAIAADTMMIAGVLLLLTISRRFTEYSLSRMWLFPSIAAIFTCVTGYYLPWILITESTLILLIAKICLMLISYTVTLLIFEYKDIRRYGFASIKLLASELKQHISR